MDKLKIGTFTWPVNPEALEVRCTREPVFVKDENGNRHFSRMGTVKRVITGRGIFAGTTAVARFQDLQALIGHTSPDIMVHPLLGNITGYLTEAAMEPDSTELYVGYRFTFCEASGLTAVN